LQLPQRGRHEKTQRREPFHLAIAAADGDDRHDGRATLRRVLHAAYGPRDRVFARNPRRSEKNEDPEVDIMLEEKRRGAIEPVEIEALVEIRSAGRGDRLESHRDLEAAREP